MRNRYARRVSSRQCEWMGLARRTGAHGCRARVADLHRLIRLASISMEPVVDVSDIWGARANGFPPHVAPNQSAPRCRRAFPFRLSNRTVISKFMRPIDVVLSTAASVALLMFVLWRVAAVKGWL